MLVLDNDEDMELVEAVRQLLITGKHHIGKCSKWADNNGKIIPTITIIMYNSNKLGISEGINYCGINIYLLDHLCVTSHYEIHMGDSVSKKEIYNDIIMLIRNIISEHTKQQDARHRQKFIDIVRQAKERLDEET